MPLGSAHYMALLGDGTVRVWATTTTHDALDIPEGLNEVIAIAAGNSHCIALRRDGTVAVWGHASNAVLPSENHDFVAIAGGVRHSLFLRRDGTVNATGFFAQGVLDIPAGMGDIVAIDAHGYNNLALNSRGEIFEWGSASAPAYAASDKIIDIASGADHGLALSADGTVRTWGRTRLGSPGVPQPATLPPGLQGVTALAASFYHSIAALDDGTIVTWGGIFDGSLYSDKPLPIPLGNVVAVAGGAYSRAALSTTEWLRPKMTSGPSAVLTAEHTSTFSIETTGPVPTQFSAMSLPPGLDIDSETGLITGRPTVAGNYVARIRLETPSAVNSEMMHFEVRPYGFSQWQALHFDAEELADSEISGVQADPNQNGFDNQTEYALGRDPLAEDSDRAKSMHSIRLDEAGALHLDYTDSPNASEISMAPWTSIDLVDWYPAKNLFHAPIRENSNVYRNSIEQIALPNEGKRFYQFRPEWAVDD